MLEEEIGGSHMWWPSFLLRRSIAILPSVSYLFPGADCTAGRTMRRMFWKICCFWMFLTHPRAETQQIDANSRSNIQHTPGFRLCDRFAEMLQGKKKVVFLAIVAWVTQLRGFGVSTPRNQGPKLRGQVCPTKWCLHLCYCWYSKISWWLLLVVIVL